MGTQWMHARRLDPVLSLLLGCLAFLTIFGGHILTPTFVDWLKTASDPTMHWLGWQFFRQAPLVQWPLGANSDYGMQLGSSIVFSDSIPLLALFFKPFSPLLPDAFQYTGLWLLLCFCLQTYFAWRLLSGFTSHRWFPLIGSLFFAISPVLLSRTSAHFALAGQWTLLAGLHFYFSERYQARQWAALLPLTALVHAYLLAMLLAIWAADLPRRLAERQLGLMDIARAVLVNGVTLCFVMWGAGYFMLGGGVEGSGFGFYRMNLAGLVDANGTWSHWLPDVPEGPGDHEGFSYLGSGMLGLGLVALCAVVWLPARQGGNRRMQWFPIALVSLLLFLFALSNQVALGGQEILGYDLPAIAEPIANAFRASGRFIWPGYYLLYAATLAAIFSRLPSRSVIALCAGMLVFQIADASAVWQTLRRDPEHHHWTNPLRSNAWTLIGQQYRQMIYVPPRNFPYAWHPLSLMASTHRMRINFGYFARTNPEIEASERARLENLARRQALPTDALYIFEDESMWQAAASQHPAQDRKLIIDELRILAPGLHLWRGEPYALGSGEVSFALGGKGKRHTSSGWSRPEVWGIWSDGPRAELLFHIPRLPEADLKLKLKGMGFVGPEHPKQAIEVLANGTRIGAIEFTPQARQTSREMRIPRGLIPSDEADLSLCFLIETPASPASLGLSKDTRQIGFGLQSIALDSAEDRVEVNRPASR